MSAITLLENQMLTLLDDRMMDTYKQRICFWLKYNAHIAL
jgi:hypothetical protein